MSDSYVTSKATMKCSCGDRQAKLTVYPDRTVFLTEKPMANISDHISLYNIAPFGRCHTTRYPATGAATAANHGRLTPMPCIPGTVTEWINGKNDYIIKGKPALLKSSYCRCKWGGVITITNDGQVDTGEADLSREQVTTEEEMKAATEAKQQLDPEAVLDGIQLALDVAGLAPGVGAIPDLLNASISALRGDWGAAGLSVLAAVPVIGDAATAAKFAKNGVKAAKKAKKATTASQTIGIEAAKNSAAGIKKNTGKPLLSITAKKYTPEVASTTQTKTPKLGTLLLDGRKPSPAPIAKETTADKTIGQPLLSVTARKSVSETSVPTTNIPKVESPSIDSKKLTSEKSLVANEVIEKTPQKYSEDDLREIFKYKGNKPQPNHSGNKLDLDS